MEPKGGRTMSTALRQKLGNFVKTFVHKAPTPPPAVAALKPPASVPTPASLAPVGISEKSLAAASFEIHSHLSQAVTDVQNHASETAVAHTDVLSKQIAEGFEKILKAIAEGAKTVAIDAGETAVEIAGQNSGALGGS